MGVREMETGIIERLRSVSTATLTIQLLKSFGMRSRAIRGVAPLAADNCRFVGPARTLRFAPAREDLISDALLDSPANPTRHLIETIEEGAVLVIDMGGSDIGGALGDILVQRLIIRGASGLVADGPMRDRGPLAAMSMPIWSKGCVASPSFCGLIAVDIDVPIGCGGVLVYPGDIVVADEDGPVIVPRHLAKPLADSGLEQERLEAWIKEQIAAGSSTIGLYPPTPETLAIYSAAMHSGNEP